MCLTATFDPPMEVRAIVRHYTFSIEDVALVRQRRRNANRLGFAVHLAYLRFPGRVLGPNETPPALSYLRNRELSANEHFQELRSQPKM